MPWLLLLIATPILCAAAGMLYQGLATRRDRRTLPFRIPGGRFVLLPDRRKIYACDTGASDTGTSHHGTPTIVFESGMVASTLNWHTIQQALAHSTRTFSYDRPGLGWSDPAASPRTPQILADELRTLLAAAGVPAPYLFVAHSYGVLPVRAFAAQTPDQVAAIVLLDPIRTEGWLPNNPAGRNIMAGGANLMLRARLPTRLGLTRLAVPSLLHPNAFTRFLFHKLLGKKGKRSADRMTRELTKMAPAVQPAVVAQWSLPGFYAGCAAHIADLPAAIAEIERTRPIEHVPTLVLQAASSPPTDAAYAHCRGPLVTETAVANAGHWIHLDQPAFVIDLLTRLAAEHTPHACETETEAANLSAVAR